MIAIEYFIIGLFAGFVIGWFLYHFNSKYDGVILIDDSNEEKTKWSLNVKTDPEEIPKKKAIRLQVHVQK